MAMRWLTLKPVFLIGCLSALFFSSTFVVNHIVTVQGANAFWLAGLRYLFTVPLLGAVVAGRRELGPIIEELRSHIVPWVLWGTVGFGLFYLPLTIAARWAPAWLIAGGWQMTIVMGSFLVPFVDKRRIPIGEMWPSLFILVGVGITEWMTHTQGTDNLWTLAPILIAAIAYPLGNRQMMRYTQTHTPSLSVYQRTFGMTIGSMPFWMVAMTWGGVSSGWPTSSAVTAALAVAIFSGLVATLLFFYATDSALGNVTWLARIEATQSLEIFFTVLLASLFFSQPWPALGQWVGLTIIMGGMLLHSLTGHRKSDGPVSTRVTSSG